MLTFYWCCLIIGIGLAVLSLLFGDFLGGAHDGALSFMTGHAPDYINPLTVVGGVTVLGGAGVLLTQYSALHVFPVLLLSLLIATIFGVAAYFAYVKPMKNAESSIAFSQRDFVGKTGEALTTIPAEGYGEVMIHTGMGIANEVASSFDGTEIKVGSTILVIEVEDRILQVKHYEVLR